ncbi:predicted protein [Histoplasma capsulatum G186AR]|uniref:Uncharacterized protein n=1 Tax=Ajellomyces capsulatus (strain G186AR / H82 / ATCC MYA-2454 / RMSCC 2432) TaxID=447093 RepID=C0NGP3_AJECG|nr:uncharacterized protein HCBG_02515 [Histoplasma capsulatum G186AR]EEH08978.1 predicted protein [Histoplasma capsulatum G186AR]
MNSCQLSLQPLAWLFKCTYCLMIRQCCGLRTIQRTWYAMLAFWKGNVCELNITGLRRTVSLQSMTSKASDCHLYMLSFEVGLYSGDGTLKGAQNVVMVVFPLIETSSKFGKPLNVEETW